MHFFKYIVMLFVNTQLQCLLAIFIHWKQIKIVVGSAMKDAPVIVNRRVKQRVRCATVFRLNMEGDVSEFEIRVVAENHIPSRKLTDRRLFVSPAAVKDFSEHLTGDASPDIITL